MATNAKVLPRGSGARMLASQSTESNRREALSLYLQSIRPYAGLLSGTLLLITLFVFKGHLIAMVDHEISSISVSGELNKVSAEQVSSKISPWLESSFLMADLNAIKTQVDSLPWVRESTVTRVWPGQIAVGTLEQKPVAIWNSQHYLNASGEVFTPESLDWGQFLPSLKGPDDSAIAARLEVITRLAEVEQLLKPYGFSALAMELKSRGVWEIRLDNGIRVALGTAPFDEKVERLVKVLHGASVETIGRMEAIDTRYPNGLAIQWKQGTSADGRIEQQ
ncbi:MAG: hypothetical protein C9356_08285 [Oleiphilus sp.]|nr:MAG: hypothetical protein C9356_08285 [Oleiphilus sp.]